MSALFSFLARTIIMSRTIPPSTASPATSNFFTVQWNPQQTRANALESRARMKIERPPLDGLLVIEPQCFRDHRGMFLEMYQRERYSAAGIADDFVQDNHSRSAKGVLRGLRFQA